MSEMSLIQECFGQGTTLEDLLSAAHVFALPKATWLSIANQLAQGLREFFHRGILHNDIKPENILVDWTTPGYPVKYIDFGRATYLTGYLFTEKDLRSVKRGQLAPEHWFKIRTSTASNIFSLGRVLTSIAQNCGPVGDIEGVARKCVKPATTDRPDIDTIIRGLEHFRGRLHLKSSSGCSQSSSFQLDFKHMDGFITSLLLLFYWSVNLMKCYKYITGETCIYIFLSFINTILN